MNDLFGHEKIRTLALCQPFASLMLHGKLETRAVISWKKPPFPLGKYLLYSTKKSYNEQTVRNLSGENMYAHLCMVLGDEPTLDLNGYALCVADLIDIRKMQPKDEAGAYVRYHEFVYTKNKHGFVVQKVLWILDFKNVRRIEPFKFVHGAQGVNNLPDSEYKRIKYI